MKKRALITGVSGQDGFHLSQLLLEKGYDVWGMVRPSTTRASEIHPRVNQVLGDLKDSDSIQSVIAAVRPDEIYNLGAQSHVGHSFSMPACTADVTGLGFLRILESVRTLRLQETRIYQASSSEMFGNQPAPQSEKTPLAPESPYAAAKVFAHHSALLYRRSYGMFVVSGIAFNHEGERRSDAFVTRKITRAAARIKLGLQDELKLGNIEARRDWGYAPDYVRAFWLMLQADQPCDYVIATGETHSVREFIEAAFGALELDWQKYVKYDRSLTRPNEVHDLCGNASLIQRDLGWEPKVPFQELVRRMVEHDLAQESSSQA